jgi:hypothetical protein
MLLFNEHYYSVILSWLLRLIKTIQSFGALGLLSPKAVEKLEYVMGIVRKRA